MRRSLIAMIVATTACNSSITEPEAESPVFDVLPPDLPYASWYDSHGSPFVNHYKDGFCTIARPFMGELGWEIAGPAWFEVARIVRVPGGWSGDSQPIFIEKLSIDETHQLFSGPGLKIGFDRMGTFAGRIYVIVRRGDTVGVRWDGVMCNESDEDE